VTGNSVSPSQRLRDLVEEIVLADQVGLDMFGLGEHHRPDYAVSSLAMVLAAAATQTKNIRLSSAVTVLSSDNPIRVFQQLSTLDNLTEGRAEIMVGRGAFVESFPLFGLDLNEYDTLFAEKLQLLMAVNGSEKFSWPGTKHLPVVHNQGVYPRPVQDKLPIWLAVRAHRNRQCARARLACRWRLGSSVASQRGSSLCSTFIAKLRPMPGTIPPSLRPR
jgi:alkanesulfonate monooxygenase SsuD/methylene tetrahydromethanopterin reductase-like flavin-dependent oxidoreductase (luciferase family)